MPRALSDRSSALPHVVGAGVNELLGQVDRRVCRCGVDGGGAKVIVGALLERGADAVADLVAQLLERVELRRICGEIVVEIGELLLPHLLDRDREGRHLAGEPLGAVIVGKVHLDGHLVPRGGAGERLVELRQEGLGAQLDRQVGGLRALERLPVHRARVVDHEDVARALPAGPPDSARRSPREAGRARPGRRPRGTSGSTLPTSSPLYSPSFAGGRTATSIENCELLPLLGQRLDVQLRIADRRDAGLEQRALVPLRERVAKGLLDHRIAPDPLDHELGGHLALAEPGTRMSPASCWAARSTRCSDGVGLDSDVDPHARVAKLGDRGPHRRTTLLAAALITAAARSRTNATKRPTGPVTSRAANRSRRLTAAG